MTEFHFRGGEQAIEDEIRRLGAAVAALYIATGDRRERQRERAAAAEAQPSLSS
jgi:hypothetical protein